MGTGRCLRHRVPGGGALLHRGDQSRRGAAHLVRRTRRGGSWAARAPYRGGQVDNRVAAPARRCHGGL